MSSKTKPRRSIILKVIILAFFIYMFVTLANLWSTLNKSQHELRELKHAYDNDKKTVEELKVLLDDETDSKIIEKAARERLGYIYSDEQIFIDISGN